MKAITKCDMCSNPIEVDEVWEKQAIQCPHCGIETTVRVQPRIAGHMPAVAVRDYLKGIREKSCYRVLRTVINFAFTLAYVAFALVIVGSIMTGITSAMALQSASLALIGFVLFMAAHQAALLLVDIADCVAAMGYSTAVIQAEKAHHI